MTKEVIQTEKGVPPQGAYSQGWRAGDFVFVSGTGPVDPATGKLVGDTIEAQTERVIDNLELILAAAGATLADVVKVAVHLSDTSLFPRYNAVYARRFRPEHLLEDLRRLREARPSVKAPAPLARPDDHQLQVSLDCPGTDVVEKRRADPFAPLGRSRVDVGEVAESVSPSVRARDLVDDLEEGVRHDLAVGLRQPEGPPPASQSLGQEALATIEKGGLALVRR
jgi:2-iminobutanoate/2-iminopropanoate deaminase